MVAQSGPLTIADTLSYSLQISDALTHAWHRNVVHRDIKPSNILITADGQAKLVDMGLARLHEVEQPLEADGDLTATGMTIGTFDYIAPEQAAGKNRDVGPAADVYALGAIPYELLTGRPPFRGETPLDTVLQVMSDPPAPPRQLHSKIPRDLETICLKCLEKPAQKRYGSASQLAEDLRHFRSGEPITARPVGRLERAAKWARRRPLVAASISVTLISALVFLGVISTFLVILARRNEELAAVNTDLKARTRDAEGATTRMHNALEQTEEGHAVRYALAGIRNVGEKAMEAIAAEREERGQFASLGDLFRRVPPGSMNRRQLEGLAGAGAFDSLEPNRAKVLANAEMLLAVADEAERSRSSGQAALFGGADQSEQAVRLFEVEPWSRSEQMAKERENFGFYFAAHPVEQYRAMWDQRFDRLDEYLQHQQASKRKEQRDGGKQR